MFQSQKYEQVASEADQVLLHNRSDCDVDGVHGVSSTPTNRKRSWLLVSLSLVVLCAIVIFGFYSVGGSETCTRYDQLVYSPAGEALRYQREVYPDAFTEKTHFMGELTPQLDAYWEETYNLPARIPKWQADKLEQPTIELPGDPGYYVILLDIFHSLHCLNEIRKSLHPEYYPPYHLRMNTTEEKAQMHLDHCVEHVRLALWCGADISPISFHWKEDGHSEGQSKYPHTCRDPRAIINWARENKLQTPLP